MENKKGFTLLELLVVVLIIGILAAIALPQYKKAVIKSKFSTLKNVVRTFADAEERYYLLHSNYTTNISNLDIDIPFVSSDPEDDEQRSYYLNTEKTMYIGINIKAAKQTIGMLKLSDGYKIAFVYDHLGKLFICIPYAQEGISYDICNSDGTRYIDEHFYY